MDVNYSRQKVNFTTSTKWCQMSWSAEALKKTILMNDLAFITPDAVCGQSGNLWARCRVTTLEEGPQATRKEK
jgi:hypothetical protein